MHDGHECRNEYDRRQDAKPREHCVDRDPDAKRVERSAVQCERTEQPEEDDVSDPRARRDRGDQRLERGLDDGHARCDQQHSDSHEQQDRGSDIFNAADSRCHERLDRITRARGQDAVERGGRKRDDRMHAPDKVQRDGQYRREQRPCGGPTARALFFEGQRPRGVPAGRAKARDRKRNERDSVERGQHVREWLHLAPLHPERLRVEGPLRDVKDKA